MELEMMQSLPTPVRSNREQQSIVPPYLANQAELFWWVEISTSVPLCTYYFGPFESQNEARDSRTGYVEDLSQEEARGIIAVVKQCQPDHLTLDQGYYSNQRYEPTGEAPAGILPQTD
jgi:Domain of unknown function (DUF1816)